MTSPTSPKLAFVNPSPSTMAAGTPREWRATLDELQILADRFDELEKELRTRPGCPESNRWRMAILRQRARIAVMLPLILTVGNAANKPPVWGLRARRR